jgi:beta-phosphoglucomutase-like phosphatase (HAD superfamily)/dTDP-glucose pyrophosphorylase
MSQRLFVFDLDGVLVDSKRIHFDSLNLALKSVDEKYAITEQDQEKIFEGLPTKEKLNILTKTRGLPEEEHEKIWRLKQEGSINFFKELKIDQELIDLFKIIKEYNVKIAVASNCIRETVKTCLTSIGVIDYVDLYLSNENVTNPKPSPEIYKSCMKYFGANESQTVIFEDSIVGKTAAYLSGAKLVSIGNRSFVNEDLIIKELAAKPKKINVLIPMAGEGSRFSQAGYKDPKPMIDVNGKSMINLVHDNIGIDAHYIFIAKAEHIEKYSLENHIKTFCKDFTIISQDGRLDGAAKTALLAKDLIDNDSHLLIANSDQEIDWQGKRSIDEITRSGIDGALLTFKSNQEKWSYAKIDENNLVKHVAEKIVISDDATCGVYYWNKGSDFVKYAEQMIDKNIKTNNEFYICPIYNEAILDQKLISSIKVNAMHGLGTPEDLKEYLNNSKPDIFFSYSEHIESLEEISNGEIMVKYKNPSFKIFTLNRDFESKQDVPKFIGDNDFGRWSTSKKFTKLNGQDSIDSWILNSTHYKSDLFTLNFFMYPSITNFNNGKDLSYPGRSVYLASYTSKYFHVNLEILPKILAIKKVDPNFKLILFGNQAKDENGIFVGLQKEKYYVEGDILDFDASHLRYWLDKLEVDFECINVEDLENKEFNYESAYIFYEKRRFNYLKAKDSFSQIWFDGHKLIHNNVTYDPHYMYYRVDQDLDQTAIASLKKDILEIMHKEYPVIKYKSKKIYISRKNFSRSHENEKEIESQINSLGYETVYFEDLNPLEQIKLCQEASDIICYLGSSIVNAYFATPETNLKVIILDDKNMPDFVNHTYDYYKHIIEYLGINIDIYDIDNKIIDIDKQTYVDSIFEISNLEFAVKYKNPSFEIFDRKPLNELGTWDLDSEMMKIPEGIKEFDEFLYRNWTPHPIITGLHNLKDVSYPDRTVYVAAHNSRFFHVMIEILPKLFLLKKQDPNFKFIILGQEKIDDKGDFLSFKKLNASHKEADSSFLKFWLDELEIDYECVNIEMLDDYNLNFRSAYYFYESLTTYLPLKSRLMHNKKFFNGPAIYRNSNKFYPFCLQSGGDSELDFETNKFLVKEINQFIENKYSPILNKNKKIYISRKNYGRKHENEKDIEEYFVSIGYESVCMEDLTPIDQIQLCKNSTDIACYLGSSLVNMYFLNDKTNLIVMSLDTEGHAKFVDSMFPYYEMMINKNVNFIKVKMPSEINKNDISKFIEEAIGK